MSSNQGWICPRCNTIWAPFVFQCLACNFNKTPMDSESGDIAPHLKAELMKNVAPVRAVEREKVESEQDFRFWQGPKKGFYFKNFAPHALKTFLNKNPNPEKGSLLEKDVLAIKSYLESLKLPDGV